MVKSMTAFGRSTLRSKAGHFSIEITSLNKKTFELALHAPREFSPYDLAVRRWVGERVHRGHVVVRIAREGEQENMPGVELLKELKAHWEGVAKELSLAEPPSLSFLASQAAQFTREGMKSSIVEKEFQTALDSAVAELLTMKEVEGKRLAADIEKRLLEIGQLVGQIEKEASKGPERYRERLNKRLHDLGMNADERVAVEVVLFADRVDISEEITRLRSHIEGVKEALCSKEAVGRSLEFLAQEMQREANTIGAKAFEIGVKNSVLALRGIVEQIREQVQNIE